MDRLAGTSLKAGLNINRNKAEVIRINKRCDGNVSLNGIP